MALIGGLSLAPNWSPTEAFGWVASRVSGHPPLLATVGTTPQWSSPRLKPGVPTGEHRRRMGQLSLARGDSFKGWCPFGWSLSSQGQRERRVPVAFSARQLGWAGRSLGAPRSSSGLFAFPWRKLPRFWCSSCAMLT